MHDISTLKIVDTPQTSYSLSGNRVNPYPLPSTNGKLQSCPHNISSISYVTFPTIFHHFTDSSVSLRSQIQNLRANSRVSVRRNPPRPAAPPSEVSFWVRFLGAPEETRVPSVERKNQLERANLCAFVIETGTVLLHSASIFCLILNNNLNRHRQEWRGILPANIGAFRHKMPGRRQTDFRNAGICF